MSENKTKENSKSTGCTILLQDKGAKNNGIYGIYGPKTADA